MSGALPTIEYNPWLGCALALALKVYLPGLGWGWGLLPRGEARERGLAPFVKAGAAAALAGLLSALLVVVAFAESSAYTPAAEWAASIAWAAQGVALGLATCRDAFLKAIRLALPSVLLFVCAAAMIMLLPRQGEWIMGGWDPGVYVNEGVYVSQNRTFHPAPDPVFSRLRESELFAFTRRVQNFTEGHPVFPLDPAVRAFDFFFFRLTPSLVALLDRCGGLRAASRINLFMGFWAALAFAGMLLALKGSRALTAFSLLFLLAHPLWLYHLHIPTSEMLQLFLLCGVFFAIPIRSEGGAPRGFLAALLFAMMLNRFSFLPFAFFLLAFLAVLDFPRPDRRRVNEDRVLQLGALALGLGMDYLLCEVTIGRLAFTLPSLLLSSFLLLLATLAVDFAAGQPRFRAWAVDWVARQAQPVVSAGALLPLALLGAWLLWPAHWEARAGLQRIIPYLGYGFLAGAAAGLYALLSRRRVNPPLTILILFLIGATAASFMNSAIAPLYPWATRRYLEYTVPLMALLSGWAAAFLWDWRKGNAAANRATAVLLSTALLISTARLSWHAWSRTEYDGYSEVLKSIAAQIDPRDIVVADHFLYGTPLRFIYGRQILNGEVLWAPNNRALMEKALATLQRIRRPGERVRFLTSTSDGLRIFPAPIAPVTLDWTSELFAYEDIQHHPSKARDFELRPHRRTFRLYSWPAPK